MALKDLAEIEQERDEESFKMIDSPENGSNRCECENREFKRAISKKQREAVVTIALPS